MKWDVMPDRAKRVIDFFLSNKELISKEVTSMIASIRKRYKLDVRLPQQEAQIQQKIAEVEILTEKLEETKPKPINELQTEEKPKRWCKASSGEKKQIVKKLKAVRWKISRLEKQLKVA